jgi:flagellar biosynthesis protein FlhG
MPRVGVSEKSAAVGSSGSRPVSVLAITSGKGGVGKTTVAVNLAMAIAARGREVMLLDADLSLANVDLLLGLRPKRNLSHVIDGECSLEDVVLSGPGEIKIVPGSSGIKRMAELDVTERAGLVYAFSALADLAEVLIIDTAAGISDSTLNFCAASHEVVVVVCNEPASIADAYAIIKVLNQGHALSRFRILVNMARSTEEGSRLFQKLLDVTQRFLNVSLDLIGTIPYDEKVHEAIKRQQAVFQAFPNSGASAAFRRLAEGTNQWPARRDASGKLEFFVERMIHAGSGNE